MLASAAEQTAKSATTEKTLIACLAQHKVACGVHQKDLSSPALLTQTQSIKAC
jgi:hypothetical protein